MRIAVASPDRESPPITRSLLSNWQPSTSKWPLGKSRFFKALKMSLAIALVEATPGELFDGNIGKLGRVVHDLPFDGNGG